MAKNDLNTCGICGGPKARVSTAGRTRNTVVEPWNAATTAHQSRQVWVAPAYYSHIDPDESAHNTVQMGISASPRRSRSIPIQRKPGDHLHDHDSFNSEAVAAYASHCEMCTWRMYNRIVTYRQKHPIDAEYSGSSYTESVPGRVPQDFGDGNHTSPIPVFPELEVHPSEDHHEDEIFDLDL